jgi:hypothetical protein
MYGISAKLAFGNGLDGVTWEGRAQTVITANALESLDSDDVQVALARHTRGDWGDVSPADWQENEVSLQQGLRLFSIYRDRNKHRFYVITEHDRSVTTVLLPEDY